MTTPNAADADRPLNTNGGLTNALSLAPGDLPELLQTFADELHRRFVPAVAEPMDLRIDLDMGIDVLIRLRICHAQLALSFLGRDSIDNTAETEMPKADARFYFPDPATARALLLGEDNAIDAFMRGDFRSDGYLMLAFQLLALFNSTSLPRRPKD